MKSAEIRAHRGRLRCFFFLPAAVAIVFAASGQRSHRAQPSAPAAAASLALAPLPVGFEQNIGQTDTRVRYLARAAGYALFLTRAGAVVSISEPSRARDLRGRLNSGALRARTSPPPRRASSLQIRFAGANPAPRISGLGLRIGRVNYFVGRDPGRWHTGIPTYDRVRYEDLYPGIDLDFYAAGRSLECDFTVAAGANPDAIRLSVEGGDARIDKAGDLALHLGDAEMTLKKPLVYQEGARGTRTPIDARYVAWPAPKRGSATVGIALASYDRARPLVIDPQLVYSTYLGGSFATQASAIAVDSKGLVYVTGSTQAADFPISPGAFQTTGVTAGPEYPAEELEVNLVFVTILNPAATGSAQLVYSTFLGGSNGVDGQLSGGIAVGAGGNVYVAGATETRDFPVTSNAFQTTGGDEGSAFLSVLNPSASGNAQLVYSSFLGDGGDGATAIALDSNGRAYLTGFAGSEAFLPVTSNALSTSNKTARGSFGTAFMTIFDPSVTGNDSLVYSTYLGGSTEEVGSGIAAGPGGTVYVAGTTSSVDFPVTRSAFQPKLGSGALSNAFFTVLNPTLNGADQLVYSTYLGGSRPNFPPDQGTAIAVDSAGLAYVTGITGSSDFPVTAGTIQSVIGGGSAAFISRFDPSKTGKASLDFSTFLGGTLGFGIAVDSRGFAYITGSASPPDFPTTKGAFQTTAPLGAAFLSVIDPGRSGKPPALVYSTFLGASFDQASAVAVDSKDVAYLSGNTISLQFPVTSGALQAASKSSGRGDAFVAIIDPAQALKTVPASLSASPRMVSFPDQFVGGFSTISAPQSLTLTYAAGPSMSRQGSPIALEGLGVQDLDSASDFRIVASATTCAVGLSLTPGSNCTIAMTSNLSQAGSHRATLTIADNASNAPQQIGLQAKGVLGPLGVSPAELDFSVPLNGVRQQTPGIVILDNNNRGPISLTGFGISGLGSFRFVRHLVKASTCGREVPANGSCEVELIFVPSATGKVTGTLKLSDVASNSPQTVKLVGIGLPAIPATPTPTPKPTPTPGVKVRPTPVAPTPTPTPIPR